MGQFGVQMTVSVSPVLPIASIVWDNLITVQHARLSLISPMGNACRSAHKVSISKSMEEFAGTARLHVPDAKILHFVRVVRPV